MAAPATLADIFGPAPRAVEALLRATEFPSFRSYARDWSLNPTQVEPFRFDAHTGLVSAGQRVATLLDRFLLGHFSTGATAAHDYEMAMLGEVKTTVGDLLWAQIRAVGHRRPDLAAEEWRSVESDPKARTLAHGSAGLAVEMHRDAFVEYLQLSEFDTRLAAAASTPRPELAASMQVVEGMLNHLAPRAGEGRAEALDALVRDGGGQFGLLRLMRRAVDHQEVTSGRMLPFASLRRDLNARLGDPKPGAAVGPTIVVQTPVKPTLAPPPGKRSAPPLQI